MPDMDNHDEESKLHRKQRRRPPLTERNCCCRWLCCACCLPVWARCIVWFIIIGIIICIIVIGALLGTFKMPTVNLAGVTEFPGGNASQITYDGSVFKLNIGLIVNVNNPNVLPIHLSDMNATVKGPSLVSYDHHVWLIVTFFRFQATIPTSDGTSAYLGDGYLAQQTVPTQSSYNFTFPFSIEYDPSSTSSQTMLNTLVENCGLTGQNATDITVSYTIHLAARVLFVTIHPTISNTATFACPLTVSNSSYDKCRSTSCSSFLLERRYTRAFWWTLERCSWRLKKLSMYTNICLCFPCTIPPPYTHAHPNLLYIF